MTTGGDGDDTDYREILNRTIRKLTSLKLQILDDRNLTEREIGRKLQAALDDVEHFRLGHNRPDVRAHNSQATQALIRAVQSGKLHYQQQQQQQQQQEEEEAP